MTDLVLANVEEGVITLTLNRPARLNALDYAMIDRLMDLLDTIEVAAEIRAVILTGAGDRAFSAGADIGEFRDSVRAGAPTALRDFVRRGQTMTARLEAYPKPIIVAINGLAFGGGCEIVEAVHLAVASESATFAKPEIKLGMPPTFGGTQRLPRLVGRRRALEVLLTGEAFSSARALDIGLVNRVVPHGDLLPAATAMARAVVRHSPGSVAAIIEAVTRGLNVSVAQGLAIESEAFCRLVPTRDLAEGLNAFVEKRAAMFSGA